jgi:hypothetical protein
MDADKNDWIICGLKTEQLYWVVSKSITITVREGVARWARRKATEQNTLARVPAVENSVDISLMSGSLPPLPVSVTRS